MSRWITVPKYDPTGFPPIDGREAQVRAGAILAVEDGPEIPNSPEGGPRWYGQIRTGTFVITTALPTDEVVTLIQEALEDD